MHNGPKRTNLIAENPVPVLLSLGIGLEICFLFVVSLGNLQSRIVPFLISFTLSFIIYLAALRQIRHLKNSRFDLAVILSFCVLFRITFLFSPPSLSDDIYRYLWEGRIVLEGENPYLDAPASENLLAYRNQYFENINNKEVSTIYPPLAQYLFALSQVLSSHPVAFKAMMALFDMLLVLVLWRTLLFKKKDPGGVIIYAWHPLPVLEFSGSGHIDAAALALFIIALYLFLKNRERGGIIVLVFSILVKFFALCLLPLFWAHQRRTRMVILIIGISVLFYLPFLDAGYSLLRGGMTYAARWRFNGSLFDLMAWAAGSVTLAKGIIIAVFGSAALLFGRKNTDPFKAAFYLTGLFLVLTPTLHPWYVTWVLPFLCFYSWRSWLYLSGAVIFSYYVLSGYGLSGEWIEAAWVRGVEYLPFYGLLLWEGYKHIKHKGTERSQESGTGSQNGNTDPSDSA